MLVTAFSMFFLAELGDETQLATMSLSSKSSEISVFAGAMLAFFLGDGVSALTGGELLSFLPGKLVSVSSGLVFIFFGVFSLIRREKKVGVERRKETFLKTFSLISRMKLGDKTQPASIFLAAELKNPLIVLLGVMLAFSIVTGIGVIFGAKLLRFLPERYLKVGGSILFIFFRLIFIPNAITDVPFID